MSEVIGLIRLKQGASVRSLLELEPKAMERFKKLDVLFPGSSWDMDAWNYRRPTELLYFRTVDDREMSAELARLAKVFLVDTLWERRLRGNPYVISTVCTLTSPFRIWAEMGVRLITEIDQLTYDRTIDYLRTRYDDPRGVARALNRVIKFCVSMHLLNTVISTVNVRKAFDITDEYGRIAVQEKMPLPELVRSIIHLKWAVEENYDGSPRSQSDLLAVLTQAFQFGLGLRIGEVLRLPVNALIEKDGEMYCLVWTEKGAKPMARYVPIIWRPVLREAVDRISAISRPYRDRARDLEDRGRLREVEESLEAHYQAKLDDKASMLLALDEFLNAKAEEAQARWALKKPIGDSEEIPLSSIVEYLPVASAAKSDVTSLVKVYKKWGLTIHSKPLGKRKNYHFSTGADLKAFVATMVAFRADHITPGELAAIIQGRSETIAKIPSTRMQGRHYLYTLKGMMEGI